MHGSLARAGKVRGQTPKVAKQDKKKKPRGRAHKRMQYNRRFVTAVVGFGKKRGPNSSENKGLAAQPPARPAPVPLFRSQYAYALVGSSFVVQAKEEPFVVSVSLFV